ncbi:MAG: glycosyltransferase [Actinomycetota bacterium]
MTDSERADAELRATQLVVTRPTLASPTGPPKAVVYLAGSRWSDIPGTDRRLVTAVGRSVPVLWVDPPFSLLTRSRTGSAEVPRSGRDLVAPGVTRLQVASLPGASRPGMRALADWGRARVIRSSLQALGIDAGAVVVASPRERFPRGIAGVRVHYATDDWIAGAGLMGLSVARIRRDLARNLRTADVAAAVSPSLAEQLSREFGLRVAVLANGCEPAPGGYRAEPSARAVLVGQLNDRLDLELLEAVSQSGIPIVVIGPRGAMAPERAQRLNTWLSSPGVEWRGALPAAELPEALGAMGVGLTPYADTAFNRGSFPLKTLEYLAAGLPVVSSPLPSVRWLDTDLIDVADGPLEFARRVAEILSRPATEHDRERRMAFARGHSWESRAAQLLLLIAEGAGAEVSSRRLPNRRQ